MDHRTFLHYLSKHRHGNVKHISQHSLHQDAVFLQRLPKKVGTSILDHTSKLQFGRGVLIIEGPNKVGLSWATFIGLSLSLLVSLLYSHFWKTEEQGFGIGQWVVAVVGAGIMAVYFHAAET